MFRLLCLLIGFCMSLMGSLWSEMINQTVVNIYISSRGGHGSRFPGDLRQLCRRFRRWRYGWSSIGTAGWRGRVGEILSNRPQ